MVSWVLEAAALVSAERLVTVMTGPEPPPLVPPAMVDQPSWLKVAARASGASITRPVTTRAAATPVTVAIRHSPRRRGFGAGLSVGGTVSGSMRDLRVGGVGGRSRDGLRPIG